MSEEEVTPTTDQRWVYVILGIREPFDLPKKLI
jgi:hypothetical protein